jgi:hypothetical protein
MLYEVVLIQGPSSLRSCAAMPSAKASIIAVEFGSNGAFAGTGSFQKLVDGKKRNGAVGSIGSTGSTGGVGLLGATGSLGVVDSPGGFEEGPGSSDTSAGGATSSTGACAPGDMTGGEEEDGFVPDQDGFVPDRFGATLSLVALALDFLETHDLPALRCLPARATAAHLARRLEAREEVVV